MYRVALGVMLGTSSLLIAYGQFRALPGQEDSLDLTATVRDALIVCISIDASERCLIPLDYLSQAFGPYFLAAVRFAVFMAFT